MVYLPTETTRDLRMFWCQILPSTVRAMVRMTLMGAIITIELSRVMLLGNIRTKSNQHGIRQSDQFRGKMVKTPIDHAITAGGIISHAG
jgi:hypothetical protein